MLEGKAAVSDSEFPDLTLIGRQQRQILNELGSIRDDVSLLTAIARRQDSTLTTLLTEIRAVHSSTAA
nr:hypothetical protein [uncultured Rhodopila sp.]